MNEENKYRIKYYLNGEVYSVEENLTKEEAEVRFIKMSNDVNKKLDYIIDKLASIERKGE